MTDANGSKQREAGKTTETILNLVDGLTRETNSAEHRFQSGWGNLLVARYRLRPGSPTAHLSDLPEHSMICLLPEGRSIVKPHWDWLASLKGHRWAWANYRRLAEYLRGRTARVGRLKKWKAFGTLTSFEVNSLEPYVETIRISDGPRIRVLSNPKLPVNLATPAGARLIGYYGDSNNRNGAFTNKNRNLHEDFRNTVRDVFGNLTITETVLKRGGFGGERYVRTNVGYIIPAALTVAGLDCTRDQKHANNPLPSWLFNCDRLIKSECLSALWDAEGSINFRDLKVRQAVPVVLFSEETIPSWPKRKPFKKFTLDNQARVLESPPLLIISAALLLYSMGIVSRLVPTDMTTSHGETTAYWQLRVQRDESIRAFQAQIKLRSAEKQSLLDTFTR